MYINKDFINKFNSKDKKKITKFFSLMNNELTLNKRDSKKMFNDFEKYIWYFYEQRESLSTILKRIPVSKMHIAYGKNNDWFSLDNSSKVYPLSMGEDFMSIYRLSYYLREDINPIILQLALDYVMIRFPLFRTSIHKGFFWNYLDSISKHYDLEEEVHLPCSHINISKYKNQSFRVVYYKNRVSCEFFHILSDAHGGVVFLTTLINEYFRLNKIEVSYNDYALNTLSNIHKEETIDAFLMIKPQAKKGGLIEKKALELDGKMSVLRPCQILHYDLDLSLVYSLAKEKDVTINELLLSFLFLILSYSTSKDGEIKIQVPVNMRKYYAFNTLRNFSLYNTISISKRKIKNLDEVIKIVKEQSREKINKEALDGVMYKALDLVKKVSIVPLFIKKPITKFIYRHFGECGSTTVLSNLGKVSLPEEMTREILKADFSLGTTLSNKVLFSIITINNTLTLTISKFTTNTAIENNLYSLLKEYNLIMKVHGSDKYEIRK